jgi:uncharacterized protein YbjQ (UPF0145 family)
LRYYYRTPEFQRDFIAFLRSHHLGKESKLSVLTDFYERLGAAESPAECVMFDAIEITDGEPISLADIAIRTHQSRVIEMTGDLEAVVEAVRECYEYELTSRDHFYAVSQTDTKEHPGYEVSNYIARVIGLCDGRRTVAEIMERLRDYITIAPQSAETQVYDALLQKARSEGLIAIYRTASKAEGSQVGGPSMAEYIEISAVASLQNQSSVQVK